MMLNRFEDSETCVRIVPGEEDNLYGSVIFSFVVKPEDTLDQRKCDARPERDILVFALIFPVLFKTALSEHTIGFG